MVLWHNSSNYAYWEAINAKLSPKYVKCRVRKKISNPLYDIEDPWGVYIGKYHASNLRP